MKEHLVVTNAEDLTELTFWIHDCFFCVSSIQFDPQKRVLSIPFARERLESTRKLGGKLLKTFEVPKVACDLSFRNVMDYAIEDQQRIDCYDFNEVRYNLPDQKLVIVTNIPTDAWLVVSRIEVELRVSKEIVSSRRFRSLFERRSASTKAREG